MATTDYCDGDYLGAYRRFLEHFVTNVCARNDQLPVKMSRRGLRDCELAGEIADITLQHLNQRICPPSLQAYLVKVVREEFKIMFQKHPEDCGYKPQDKTFSPLKLMQTVTNKVNEICQRYLDNSRLALLPPPPSIPLPLASSYAIRNKRRKMEDRSVVLHDLHTMFSIKNDSVVNYYAVFDGHAGQECATYCAAHLHQYLIESPYYPMEPELALRDAFRTTDHRFTEIDDTKNSGATAVCALLYDKTLYIAWAGDSQAALIKNGRGINLTIPHKPERPDEKLRIKSLGGEVIYFGTWRVNGVLNVSRAIGDVKYKPFITEEPDIKRIELDGTEDFLVIACDGFWERATEDIVASLVYEFVCSGQCDYSSAAEALVNWARQNQSEDNISVIVVFLTPPAEIAAKSFFDPRPVQSSATSMEPGYQQDQQPYDLDFGFAKQAQQPAPAALGAVAANGNGDGFGIGNAVLEPINGRHRPKPPRYNDDDDDDEDEEDEDEDVDLGPETNVDMVDDVAVEEFGKLDQAMGQNYPDEFLLNMPAKRENDDYPVDGIIKERHQNELIPEADNVADSEDSEDEWNYYRPDDKKSADSAPAPSAPEPEQDVLEVAAVAAAAPAQPLKDPALVEKSDQCEEERELCSPKPSSEDGSSIPLDNSNRPLSPEGDDVTAEYDEILEREPTKDQPQPETLDRELKEYDIESEATLPQEDLPFDKAQPEEQHREQQQFEELEQSFEQSSEPQLFEQSSEPQLFEQHSEPQLFEPHSEPQPFEPHSEPQLFEQPSDPQLFEQPSDPQLFEQPSESQPFEQPSESQPFGQPSEPQPFEQPSEPQPFEKSSDPQLFEQLSEPQPSEQPSEPQFFEQLSEPQRFEHLSEPQLFEQLSKPQPFEQSEHKLEQLNNIETNEIIENKENVEHEVEDMESHLNPDAAEFVPTVTTPPLIPQLINTMSSDLIAGSPLKQSQRALKNRNIPSEEEFQQEVCRRPSEIDDSADFSNGEASPLKMDGGFDAEDQKTMVSQLNLDESEISSTKAEFGDETANFSVTSELYKTGASTIDCSYTGSDRDFDFSKTDAMATSMTPGDFKSAFEQDPDLNKVHELSDDDLMGGDVQNGSFLDEEKNMIVDDVEEGLGKDKIELDLDNFVPQQQQNAEVFSAIVEQRESDNKDLFMNMRNTEHGYDFEQQHNLIDTTEPNLEIASAEDVKIGGFTTDDMPTYASNNPFAADYVPEPEHNIQNLADDMQNVHLDEPKQQLIDNGSLLTPEEPTAEKANLVDVMLNPLDLNFGVTSSEQNIDDPALVTPVKEPEAMSSKFEEENLMSQSMEGLQSEPVQKPVQEELFMQSNHMEDFSPVSVPQPEENLMESSPLEDIREEIVETLERKSINLSESLQEFTGLEEQLSPKQHHDVVKDDIIEEPQILKENLVDEQKDVEEINTPSPVPEVKIVETPEVTNESSVLSNETSENVAASVAAVAATAAVAAASAASVAAKTTSKSATTTSKTSKPTATSKIGAKTSPTSPTKTGVGAKAGTPTAKKPTTSTTPRAKPLAGTANKTTTNTATKTTSVTKSTSAPRATTGTTAKPAPRTSTSSAASKTKPLSSVTSRISSTTTDKKPTANGEVKPTPKPAPKTAPKPPVTSTAPKTGLVKATSTTSRTSTTMATTKPRSTSATATKSTISKVNSTNVTSSTNTTAARPKTAPASTLNAGKSKIGSIGAKSPMIDKQIKETANKQISSARTTATATKSRLSVSSSSTTTTTTTKRTSLVQKQSVTAATASPTKKPAPITKPGSKTSTATSKVNSKVTSTTKTTAAATNVVQNGVCEAEETKITTNTTTTTNIEEDIPKKDVSPIEPLTDNQLITAE